MKVALLGTGLMGYATVERLLESGHQVVAYNRTRSKVDPLQEQGVEIAEDPATAIHQAECVILMLSDAGAIETVLFTPAGVDLKDRTFIQMGTIAPGESIVFNQRIRKKGGCYLECPVLGSRTEAREGRLILMVGSSDEDFNLWLKFLQCLGTQPRRIGEVGTAAAIKLCLNQLIASLACTYALSLGLLEKEQINVETFAGILRESALYAPMFDKKLSAWTKRQFSNPNFPLKHLLKDVDLFLKEADTKDLGSDHLQGVRAIIVKALDLGWGEEDYSSLYNAINPLPGKGK